MKKFIMILALALALSISVAYADIYPTTVIVRDLDYQYDLVICEDYNGNEWILEGIDNWDIDDMISMIMDDMDTSIIEDDEIIMVRYSGYAGGL